MLLESGESTLLFCIPSLSPLQTENTHPDQAHRTHFIVLGFGNPYVKVTDTEDHTRECMGNTSYLEREEIPSIEVGLRMRAESRTNLLRRRLNGTVDTISGEWDI
jgi:hypothetical protein